MIDVFTLGLVMIAIATMVGYFSLLLVLLSALVESIVEHQFGWFMVTLVLLLLVVGIGLVVVGMTR